MKIAGITDIGLVREKNQDNYLITKNNKGDVLAIVCDGIGGAKAGDVASLITTKNIGEKFSNIEGFTDIQTGETWLKKVLRDTNDLIYSKTTTNTKYTGMGTTFVGALIIDDQVIIANVGDSRAYILANDILKQITVDHSLVHELVMSGQITELEQETHPQRNILTNALGVVGELKIDTFILEKTGLLLLCTDGLSGYVKDIQLQEILSNKNYSQNEMLDKLVDTANEVGGYDNITVVIADFGGQFNE